MDRALHVLFYCFSHALAMANIFIACILSVSLFVLFQVWFYSMVCRRVLLLIRVLYFVVVVPSQFCCFDARSFISQKQKMRHCTPLPDRKLQISSSSDCEFRLNQSIKMLMVSNLRLYVRNANVLHINVRAWWAEMSVDKSNLTHKMQQLQDFIADQIQSNHNGKGISSSCFSSFNPSIF